MKLLSILVGALFVVAAPYFAARHFTMSSLTSADSIFDGFEQTESLWLYSDKIGAASASGVERAKVAIGGPLGLSSQEAVYFIAIADNEGRPLSSSCEYRVTGTPIDTRWWSLTLYDRETQHYVPNVHNRSSWNSVTIPRTGDGNWLVNVSPTEKEEAWLPAQAEADKSFELNLRVYNPSDATRAALPNINLPDVERISC